MRTRWLEAYLALALVLGGLSAFSLARDIGQPFGGFYPHHNLSLGVWQVEGSTPPWWPPLASGAIHYTDHLLTIDGQPFGASARGAFAAAAQAGNYLLTLRRDGITLEQRLPLEAFTLGNYLDLKLPDLINGFGFWLLALAVYRARPRAALNRTFALTTGVLATMQWLTIQGLFQESDWLTELLRLGWSLSAPFLGVAFVHLTTLFPQPLPQARRWMPALYAFGGASALLYAGVLGVWWSGIQTDLVLGWISFGFRISMGLFGLAVVFYLLRISWLLTRPEATPRQRRLLTLVLLGAVLALPHVTTILAASLFTGSQNYFLSGLDLRYLTLAVPLTFAFVILRYHAFQSHQPVLIGILALAGSALAASVGAWLFTSLQPEWTARLGGSPFPLLFFAALVGSLLWGGQAWESIFNQLFQLEQRSYAVVRQVGQQVLTQPDAQALPHTLARALVETLDLARAAVWLRPEARGALGLAGQFGDWPAPPPMQLSGLAETNLTRPTPIAPDTELPGAAELARAGVSLLAPLAASGQLIGALGLGQRDGDELFDERDRALVELIAQQSTLFLLTTLQVEQLRRVPQQLAEAEERERQRIAQELHDTTQQFLGRLPFFLQVSRDAVSADPAEAEKILARLLPEVEAAAQTLRQIRQNLAPTQLAQGLSQPLLALVEQFRRAAPIEIEVDLPPDLDAGLTPEARLALYRVVQQALDNIVEHAQARRVTLALAVQAGRLCLNLSDDGRGSSAEARAQAAAEGSFGLRSMRARLTSLGGEFQLESAPGQGTHITAWLPLAPPE